ncbi:nuclear transport factor 2 family protein [Aestuariibacter sp. GS-14]|uniref:nuclear transport factor 2 family protein n=1 Tax=Aestuariibacter sp. GS-14 TaxID=2590670 RepID=UPI00112C0446|nr:nuclear transport factor 2 family protein [Aestuariibacter sp. GS-14]TPV53710.1 nuclear transport factor 2 family protein [Aestuariibacter sp. GS-14]
MSFQTRFTQFYADLANVDIDDLDTIYHPETVFKDPIATHTGIESVKRYFGHLLDSTRECRFEIHHFAEFAAQQSEYDAIVEWTMHLVLNNANSPIHVDGVSLLKLKNERVIYHRDYYDMGEMVYEHIPILKRVILYIKKRLTK